MRPRECMHCLGFNPEDFREDCRLKSNLPVLDFLNSAHPLVACRTVIQHTQELKLAKCTRAHAIVFFRFNGKRLHVQARQLEIGARILRMFEGAWLASSRREQAKPFTLDTFTHLSFELFNSNIPATLLQNRLYSA